ncbi:hypothetical protein GCM10010129_48300 [Streptomyces fumigatiscleroticus]|nr:hypothetical protein GCM10010129_48300 [Streptomyces fumigatiscleroticus]
MSQVIRLLGTAVLSAAALTALPAAFPAAHAQPAPGMRMPPPARDEDRSGDRLTVTVRDAGEEVDGTYELHCHPSGGSHPAPDAACAALERITRWGTDAFASEPRDSVCTMQYGGPATAHVTGVWAGRPVDAAYDRSNGCRIDRWDRLVPLLPRLTPKQRG